MLHADSLPQWVEGRTKILLPSDMIPDTHMPRGPAKIGSEGFVNPAMASCRTRSVLLLQDALEHGGIGKKEKPLRVLEALGSTGFRSRRWRKEIPIQYQNRFKICVNDRNIRAIEQGQNAADFFEPKNENYPYFDEIKGTNKAGITWSNQEANQLMFEQNFQWIDLDPFGSPVSFLSSAIQSLPRVGFLEVTATDTAALCGSSPTSGLRRYGSRGLNDEFRYDDAIRILIAHIAKIAAQFDRKVEPVLSMFDGHFVRISLLIKKSKLGATDIYKQIGWRNRSGLSALVTEKTEKASGPLWIGPIFDSDIASRLTEEKAEQICGPDLEEMPTDWDQQRLNLALREIRRSVRHIADAAPLLSQEHLLIPMDVFAKKSGRGGPPSIKKSITALQAHGFGAARGPYPEPTLITNADESSVMSLLNQI
ncbi:MAG TPA: hypothetical protein D7H86_00545 [Candidatus Poseidoniales archaeon]|nr:MAG TPA: hypothetical protein D7H86_00545 [Candidatus Poseidoniales archaeon]